MDSTMKNLMLELKLYGLLKTLEVRLEEAQENEWGFSDFLSALLTDERHYRRRKNIESKIKKAKFRTDARFENFDFTAKRDMNKSRLKEIQKLGFLSNRKNLLLMGPTGVGKTFLATAIGHEACEQNYSVIFLGVNLFIEQITIHRLAGTYLRFRDRLIKCDLLIFDDLGIKPMPTEVVQDFYDILEERYQTKSTVITSQLPLKNWKEVINDEVALEAILDRIIHGDKIEMKGESYRKKRGLDKNK